mgnify:CR=1 FL=1
MRRGLLALAAVALVAGGAFSLLRTTGDAAEPSMARRLLRGRGTAERSALAAAAREFGTRTLPAPVAGAAPAVVASGGGQLQLRVVLEGAPPAVPAPDARAVDARCPATVVDDAVRLDARGGVAAAIVWVEGAPPAGPWRDATGRRRTVAFDGCRAWPALQVVPPGTTLELLQRDSLRDSIVVRHVARTAADTVTFEADGQLVPFHSRTWPAGAVTVRSLRFGWSRALVFVAPNPSARLTSDAGTATLDSLAPGTRVVRAWHPRLGETSARVTVRGGASTTATLTLRAPR